jgi:hypothetical protein
MAQTILGQWWWVGVVCSTAALFYFNAMHEKRSTLKELSIRFEEIEKEKTLALQKQEDLRLQIASQSDPGWIEMVLMRDLGLVPEGWLKVHFKKQ